MKIRLSYGKRGLTISIPHDADVTLVRKPSMPIIADPASAVAAALDRPERGPGLGELARGARSATIAICDITRPVPNHLFLRPMIQRLIAAGVTAEKITVLVATGLHRPNEGSELAELIGDPWVLDRVKVENHFARDDDQHVTLGRTPIRDTVVRIDRRFVEADLRIVTGLVEPHFMAGYSGGRKVIAPGLAHAETITTFHSARFMDDPAARNCNFEGNPLHEEQIEIVKMLGGAWALNTVLDEERRLAFVNFGEVLSSHRAAVDFARGYSEVEVPRKYEVVVTTAAGYPLDKTYYQTIKGMVGAMGILAPGGDLIVASECSEGMGSAEFVKAQKRLIEHGADAFFQEIMQKSHADVDEWQTQMQLKPQGIGNLLLYSDGLSSADWRFTGVARIEALDQAIASSLDRSRQRSIAVIPEGPYVVPYARCTNLGQVVN